MAALRPTLTSWCERAVGILGNQAATPRSGVIRVQVRGGELIGYLVRGTGGAVYRVEAKGTWRCTCPDHHGRHRRRSGGSRACKHGLACWALWRAAVGAPAPAIVAVKAKQWGVDYHATRDEIAAMVEKSVREPPAAYHPRPR